MVHGSVSCVFLCSVLWGVWVQERSARRIPLMFHEGNKARHVFLRLEESTVMGTDVKVPGCWDRVRGRVLQGKGYVQGKASETVRVIRRANWHAARYSASNVLRKAADAVEPYAEELVKVSAEVLT